MSTWTDVKNLILQKLPDIGINVISPKRVRDSLNAIIDEIIASAPDPVEFEWKATLENGDSKIYEIGEPTIDDNRWFIAIAQNSNKKPVLPDGSINETYWREENSSTSRYIDNWEEKLYTYSVEIVLHNKKLYLLDRDVVGTGPFLSEDIDAEIEDEPSKWYDLSPDAGGGGIDPSNIVNDFSTDPNDANKVAGANAVYDLVQILQSNDVEYDTLQEIVDFIKTIDTDGELVAAIDTAVGDDLWRKGGTDELTSFSSILDFSKNTIIRHQVSGAIEFTLGANPQLGKKAIFYLVANGLNVPTFDTEFVEKFNNYDNTQNKVNRLYFEYVGNNTVLYEITYV